MTDQSAVEESLRALARDLVAELAAARAVELTGSWGPAALELAGPAVADPDKRTQALVKVDGDINATRQQMGSRPLWRAHGLEADQYLARAQDALAEPGQAADVYQHLAHAHQAGVEQVLPRAQEPDDKDAVRRHLDRIQGHMEDLDKVTGTKPDHTRRVLGTAAEQNERASAVRDGARDAVLGAVASGDEVQVGKTAQQHHGLVDDDTVQSAAQQARALAQMRDADTPPMPPYHHGAAAVYPQAGTHARSTRPGGTLSGHENMHRAQPMPSAPAPHPAEAELARAKQKMAQLHQREAKRREADLKTHLADMKAADAAYKGQAAEGEYRPLSDSEFAAHKDFAARQVEQALRAGKATDQRHTLDGHGQVWTPERSARHAEVVRDFVSQQTDVPSQRQALVMGGLPGTDKEAAASASGIDLSDYAVLSLDKFKQELAQRGMVPEVQGLSPLESTALVHEEAAYLASVAASVLERQGKNIAWDIGAKNHGATARLVQQLKAVGYKVHPVLADDPADQAADRAESSYRSGLESYRKGSNPHGGRHIPRGTVLAGEGSPRETFGRLPFDGQEHLPPSVSIPSVEALRKSRGGSQ